MRLAALLLIAGCSAPHAATVVVPDDLRSCAAPAAAPAPPRRPRTVEQVAVWANRMDVARQDNQAALVACDRRRAELVRLIERE